MKIYFLFLCFFPFLIFSQSIQENLDFINAQFEKYNQYGTRFEVDQITKTITCQDKFGTYIAFFEDVEFRLNPAKTSIGIYCIEQSNQCISTIQKNGEEGPELSDYNMDLHENNKAIPQIDNVLEKFKHLKQSILKSDSETVSSQVQGLKYRVDLQLRELNAIFKEHSNQQNLWSFNWDNYWFVSESDSCKILIPLEKVEIEYQEKENVQSFRHGVVILSEKLDILKKCKTSESKLQTTSFQMESLDDANAAIENFKTIQLLISDGPQPIAAIATKVDIDQLLSYINNQFKKYNQYNTRFFVDESKKELIWIQEFGETRVAINQIDVKADYENGWLVIFCAQKNDRCIHSANGAGKTLQSYEYSMSLIENDRVISHIDEVIDTFKKLIAGMTN